MKRLSSPIAETDQYVIRVSSGNGVMARRQWAWLLDIAARASNPTPPVPLEARHEQPSADRAS